MKRLAKCIASLSLTAILLFNSSHAFAYSKLLYTYEQTEMLSPGVMRTIQQRMTDSGWFNINMITVDLTNPAVQSTVLLPEAISQKAPLSELANTEENVVVAINGDFFDTQGQSTLGMIVKDGDYVTSSIHDDRFYTYLQMADGRSYIAKVLGESTRFKNDTYTLDITYKNKPYLQYDRAIVFDSYWGNTSIGNTNSEPVIEVVVANNKIQSIRYDMAPVEIPEDGYVISAVGTCIPLIQQNFKIGDTVELNSGAFLKQLDQAIGGGAKILSDGSPVSDFSLDISGRHPRSVLGFSADNNTLYLATIDGRHNDFVGMTQTELAYLMAEFGAWNAINLDGGGSSEMMVRTAGEDTLEIINYPSDGVERRIHNGLGIRNTAPYSSLSELEIITGQDRYFLETGIPLSIKGIDANYHPAVVDMNNIVWTVSGVDAEVQSDRIVAHESGTLVITASYGQVTTTKTLEILSAPVRLSAAPHSARLMPDESVQINLTGYDSNGFSASLGLEDVSILQSGVQGHIGTNSYTADESGSGYIRFSLGDVQTYMAVGIGENTKALYNFETNEAASLSSHFVGYPQTVTGSYDLTSFAHSGETGGTLKYDFTNEYDTRAAYLEFSDSGLKLPENSTKIKLWVYGDYSNGHWLRGKISDSKGTQYTIDFAQNVDWSGWRQVEATFPKDTDIVTLDRIYLVETDPSLRDKGVVVFDDLEVVTTTAPPEQLPEQNSLFHVFHSLADDTVDLELLYKTNATLPATPTSVIDEKRSANIISDSVKLLTLDNSGGKLSRTSSSGWNKLLNYAPADTENTVFLLKDTLHFKNNFDEKLFTDTLQKIRSDYNQSLVVVSPGMSDSIEQIDGIWYVTFKQEDNTILRFDLNEALVNVEKQTIVSFDENSISE